MPTNQFVKKLIVDGYVGRPYQLSMRYFTGYARDGAYAWRFDEAEAGSGILGDLGSHWLDMSRWFLGEIVAISAHRDCFVPRAPTAGQLDVHPGGRQRRDPRSVRVGRLGHVAGQCGVLGRHTVRSDPRARLARQRRNAARPERLGHGARSARCAGRRTRTSATAWSSPTTSGTARPTPPFTTRTGTSSAAPRR